LIIDEAHKLSFDLLEEIRLLSNMETGDDKLINIFLVGQPELNKKLSDSRCRPLLQRISIRHHIPPLNLPETKDYMDTRLKVAGAAKANQIFSKKAIEAIYDFSRGYPREINILADNALLLGYSKGIRKLTPSTVKQCYEDMQLDIPTPEPSVQETENRGTSGRETEKRRIGELASGDERVETQRSSRTWKWAAVIVFFLAFTIMGTSPIGKEIIWRFNALISSTYQAAVAKIAETSLSGKNETEGEISNILEPDRIENHKPPSHNIENHKIEKAKIQEPSAGTTVEKKTEAAEVREVAIRNIEDNWKAEVGNKTLEQPLEAETSIQDKEKSPPKIVIVGRGDTLSGLTRKIYGKTSDDIITMVKAANPGLKNINFIKSGQKIVFPQLIEFKNNATFTVHVASYKLYKPALNMYRDLLENGYEVYILTKENPHKGRLFRVTIGYFKTQKDAKDYATTIVKQGVATYANPIEVEMK
jgi:phage tail protein X